MVRSEVRAGLALAPLLGLLTACVPAGFRCDGDPQCGATGVCEPSGYCSFEDDACDSGRRYAELAGTLSGRCVPADEPDSAAADASSMSGEDGGAGSTTAPRRDPTAGPADLVFTDDAFTGEFGSGTFDGTAWDEGAVTVLPSADAGSFVSRVFDAGEAVDWTTLSWQPEAPYGKPLPGGGHSEAGYEGAADLAALVLLLHLDQPAPVSDASGRGQRADFDGSGSPTLGPPGVFDDTVEFDARGGVRVTTWGTGDFDFVHDDMTWSLWLNSTSSCDSTDDAYASITDITGCAMSLGCASPGVASAVVGRAPSGRLSGAFTVTDGQWHHLAVTKSGSPDSHGELWVDGVRESEVELSHGSASILEAPSPLTIGLLTGWGSSATAALDEVAVWRRALGPDEVRALYERGALRLRVQVRTCEREGCAGAGDFVGPAGASSTFFRDPANALEPGAQLSIVGLGRARYFQYRVELDRLPGAAAAPRLRAVTIRASR